MPAEYDPNDEQYLSTAERLAARADDYNKHIKKWLSY